MPQLHTSIAPEILNWALDRSGKTPDALANKFPKLTAWQSGDTLNNATERVSQSPTVLIAVAPDRPQAASPNT